MPPTHTDEGLLAAAAIRAEAPGTGVLVLSQYVKESYALALLEAGTAGAGYLLKQRVMEPDGFVRAVREVARGGTALDPEVVGLMLGRRRPGGPLDALAPAERDVLARVAEGQSNRAIAGALGLSEHAVERRLAGVFAKLDLAVGGGRPPPRPRRARLPPGAGGRAGGLGCRPRDHAARPALHDRGGAGAAALGDGAAGRGPATPASGSRTPRPAAGSPTARPATAAAARARASARRSSSCRRAWRPSSGARSSCATSTAG